MNQILITIPVSRDDTQRAELLLDLVYQIDNRTTKGSCLLVFAPEVHQEQKDKLKIAAELAFTNVDLHDIRQLVVPDGSKPAAISSMFYLIAQHITSVYRTPWLWLEPDSMPLKANWRESLADAYYGQARQYLCRKMQAGQGGPVFAARTGIYPPNCIQDIMASNAARVPFHESIADRAAFTALFQETEIKNVSEIHKVRADALVLHSDKQGVLADWVRQANAKPQQHPFETMAQFSVEHALRPVCEVPDLNTILNPPTNGVKDLVPEAAQAIVEHEASSPPNLKIPIVAPKKRGRPAKTKPELATA